MFECSNCNYTNKKMFFKCPVCGDFNINEKKDLEKNITLSNKKIDNSKNIKKEFFYNDTDNISDKIKTEKIDTGFKELNILFGGEEEPGLVKNSFTLLAGAPGIGKSTLLLQLINNMAKKYKCAYISNEESIQQIKSRANRLKLKNKFVIENENSVENIIINFMNFDILVIDSINTISSGDYETTVGGVKSIKEVTLALMEFAKKYNKTIILIGQLVKDDSIAGPKQLEHMVDATIFFDFFDDQKIYRYVQPKKNRFAKIETNVIFEMTELGLKEIDNPSLLFVNKELKLPGTALTLFYEGNKPIFLEMQSLVVPTTAERTINQSIGIDTKRLYQINAILQKHLKLKTFDKNIFVNIIGGFNIKKPYLDLSIAASILSSYNDICISDMIFIGEIGLNGEIRRAPNEKLLISASEKYGYKNIICYTTGYKTILDVFQKVFVNSKK